jgi:RNA polymerase sigma-70 factor (ECF subfamily)
MKELQDSNADDGQLLARLHERDAEALFVLYRRYSTRVFSLAYRILGDRGAAEEVVQDVFHRLWEKSALYEPEKGLFVSWLLTVTRNLALDVRRKETRRANFFVAFDRTDSCMPTPSPSPVESLAQADAVARAMETLPPAQRQVVEQLYFAGLTNAELARTSGEALGTIKTRARLALKKMRALLMGVEELP